MTEKEIGIGKLMGYVEEMQKEGINICRPQVQEYYILRMILISKHYGLIQWLVENDKIDTEKVIDTAKSSVIDTYYYEEGIDDIYIPLLMVLAIQDEPIEYLLSVIK